MVLLLLPSIAAPYSTQVRQQLLWEGQTGIQEKKGMRDYLKTTLRFSISLHGYGFFRRDTGWAGGGESGQPALPAKEATPDAMRCLC